MPPILAAVLGLLLVLLLASLVRKPSPTLPATLAAIDKAIDGRVGEAGTHSRGKFSPALEATRKSVKDAVTKLFTG